MPHDQRGDEHSNRITQLEAAKANFPERETDGEDNKYQQNWILL
ncbi:Uncharacterised protein [Vibrio cholerae]|uniref:Uncharacterized protein n=1 Tax=Vibrio cholerae TaxID=666 RepID=A0A655USU4_VIBCL|nr:Uncharacterised protein [Vibrio cholerae]CSA82485.1 Uncharacterised protein [Vibrio cholerae]CSA90243.1 Uncharacterised protein [Vibrio cholerae]CSB05505.1 Uncharacterised protein [Vibrio cholerae]CSB07454.1 Uncharacterised protein [Vibrio cholerae]